MLRLNEFEMPLKALKTCIGVTETRFVGHVLDGAIYLSLDSLECVLEAASPSRPPVARILVGVARWIHQFVPRLAELLAPLTGFTGNALFEFHGILLCGAGRSEGGRSWLCRKLACRLG